MELAVTSVTDQNSALTISHAGQGAASALNIQFDNVNNQSRAIVVDNGHTVLSFQELGTLAELQQANASVINFNGTVVITDNDLPQNAINGQTLFIVGNGTSDLNNIGANNVTVAGFLGATLMYMNGSWEIISWHQ